MGRRRETDLFLRRIDLPADDPDFRSLPDRRFETGGKSEGKRFVNQDVFDPDRRVKGTAE